MVQDSISAIRIPQYLYEKQNIFFINFIQQQDEDLYYTLYSSKTLTQSNTITDKTFQKSNPKNYANTSILTANQLLKSETIKPIASKNKQLNENWVSLSILTCLLLFALTKLLYFKRFGQLFKALFVNRVLSLINRESNLKKEGITFLLVAFALISTSLFFYQVYVNYFNISWMKSYSSISIFFLLALVLFVFYFVKFRLIRFIGYVFNTQAETHDHLLFYLIFILVFGIVFLIPVIIQFYISFKIGFYISLSFLLLSEVYRIIRSIMSLFSSSKFSVLFIFLYLCTVEIIPAMIVYKVLLNFTII